MDRLADIIHRMEIFGEMGQTIIEKIVSHL